MRRLPFMLVGLVCLVLAAVMLAPKFQITPKEKRTTGGVLYSQQEVAASGGSLGVATDVQSSDTPSVQPGFQPQIGANAMSQMQQSAAPAVTTNEQAPPANTPPLTTDIVLNDQTGVAVAPLSSSNTAIAAPEGQGGASGTLQGGYEQRVVEIEWPKTFRVGGADSVRIKLKMLQDGSLQPVAEIASHEVVATPILLTDRYDTHTAYVTASISAPDFSVEWVEPQQQVLERGGTAEWRWTLKSEHSGKTVIALGLTINWMPKTAGAQQITAPIWGQTLQVNRDYVLGGLSVPQAGTAGTVLAVLGVIAEIPFFTNIVTWFWGLLFGRRRRRRRRNRYYNE